MTNKRYEPVSYRPFRTQPLLADGLLAVARPGGELLNSAADALFRIADQAAQSARQNAQRRAAAAGETAPLDDPLTIGEGAPQTPSRGGPPAPRGGRFAPEVDTAIKAAAARHGVDAGTLSRIAQLESGGNPKAKNPRSSAGGLFQFIDSTAAEYQLADRFDAGQASDAAARLLKFNRNHLARTLGRAPSMGELYLAHQQGAGGAAKLLANPNASAASVVGARAVQLNGGRPGMTAGEFAQLWVKKAEGGGAIGRAPDPPPAGFKISGGRWRPSGSDTIEGRAYDEAGARTYLQRLETETRRTGGAVFDRNSDNPEALAGELSTLKTTLLAEHVFPEVRADFEATYDRMAAGFVEQARRNQTEKRKAEDRADFLDRTTTLDTEVQKRIAQADPAAPGFSDSIASTLVTIDSHYDSAVAAGELSPEAGAKAKADTRRRTALGFYARQAEALPADGVKAMRAEMEADFAAGRLEGVDGEGWQQLNADLARVETAKRAAADRQSGELRKRGDAQAARVADGFEPDPAEMARLALDGDTAETDAKIAAARAIRAGTVRAGDAAVAALRKAAGDTPDEAQLRTLTFAEETLKAKKAALATDPVSYAEKQRLTAPTPSLADVENPDELEGVLARRLTAADEAAKAYGIAPRFLKAGEASALGQQIRADPNRGAAITAAIVAGAGWRAPQVLAEFGDDAPMIEEAGAILAFGGSARAAEDVIAGYGRGTEGKALKGLKPDAARQSFRDTAGDALALAPRDGQRIGRAAAAIARKRIADEGIDPESDEALAIHARATQEAAGAIFDRGVQFGGFADFDRPGAFQGAARVLLPPEIRADRFEELIAALTDADLAALAVPPRAGLARFGLTRTGVPRSLSGTLRAAVPVAVKGGFAFALGDPAGADPQFIEGRPGEVFVLDLLALRDRLSPRVPGAFR